MKHKKLNIPDEVKLKLIMYLPLIFFIALSQIFQAIFRDWKVSVSVLVSSIIS